MIALTAWLGLWQGERAQEKSARQALLEARMGEPALVVTGAGGRVDDLLFRRVQASGRWRAQGQVYIDNQIHQGRAGFHVITPLMVGERAAVLVNRGWAPRTAAYPAPPAVPVPEGPVTVQGIATVPPRRVLELSADTVAGNVWQNLSIGKYATRMKLEVLPVVILAAPPAAGLAPVVERPDAGVDKHREYALTWFSLAATLVVLWLVYSWRRERA